jgi:hypothetical protein
MTVSTASRGVGRQRRYAYDMGDELTWDQRIFDAIDPGVDVTLLEENLKRTPTERIERMLSMLRLADDLRNARGHGHPSNP